MNYLDFYSDNSFRMTYSKDLSITQYSTEYTIRVHSRTNYPSVSMEITTTDGLKTYKKYLVHELNLIDGYHIFSYKLGLDVTGSTVSASKAIIKLSFTAFLDSTDESKKLTSGLCYLPLLASNEDRPSDMSISESDKATIMSKLNELDSKISSLKLDKAQDYDETKGTIKDKFDSLETSIGTNASNISDLDTKLNNTISKVNTNISNIEAIQSDISDLKQNKLFEIVDTLPSTPDTSKIYIIKEDNVYRQYVYSNNTWKSIGETTDINISNYYTKSESDNKYATKSSIPTKTSDLTNDSGYITNTPNAFSYNNLTDKPSIPDVSNINSKLSTIETSVSNNTSSISNILTNITNIQSDISDVSTVANRAEAKIDGLETAKVFNTRNALLTYIKTQPSVLDRIGTSYFIKAKNTPDYWVAAIFTEPTSYTNADGEIFTDVYYGIEKYETNVTVEGYATEAWVEAKGYITESSVNTLLASKESLNNKASAIGDGSDTQYPTTNAVKAYTDTAVDNLNTSVSNTYATKEALNTKVNETELANYATIEYVDNLVDNIPTPDVSGQISEHNTSSTSHQDIRNLINTKQDKITTENKLDYSLIDNTPDIPVVPTNISSFTNDVGYITESSLTSIKADVSTNKSNIETIQTNVDTLNGTGEGSVKKTVSDEIAKIINNAPESFDTLKEISDWISSHEGDASAMNTKIQTNTNSIASLQSSKQDKITESNKLDYSLLDNVPQQTSAIIRKWVD